jgi:uncharacterized protein YigE (DUF2233 family)
MKAIKSHIALFALLLITGMTGNANAQTADKSPCSSIPHEGTQYTVCQIDLTRSAVRFFWQRPDGQPYSYLTSVPTTLPTVGKLRFSLNAGMFHPDYKPVGLYIESGREIVKASTTKGPGNFHLKPNGVFYIAGDTAGVMETSAYLKAKPPADFATQSGPMLVIGGRLHPRFTEDGESKKLRDGVGVINAQTLVFAISEEAVSFGAFARLFRDTLKAPNALFLDGGSVPALYVVPDQNGANVLPLGPMIGVYDRK